MKNKRFKLAALLLMALLVVGMCGCQTGESNDSASPPVVSAPPETKPNLFGGSGSGDSPSPPVVPAPPETKPNLFGGSESGADAPVSHEPAPPSGQAVTVTAIDGHSMVKAKDAALLLQLETYIDADDMVCFEQDGKAVRLAFDSPFVFQYQYRVDYLTSNCVRRDDEIYVPLSFISQYLSIDGQVRDDEYIAADVEAFDMYDVIK
ncbi:MAG: hypothetical protein Q4B48_07705, partial [Syntrophomonadaceae bacterium]|nr:hypothetical protein [Syntrophomonadaceae bacterium]